MDEHDVVEAGTDLLFGDPKSVLKKIGLSILDKKQFEAIFVSAGKTVAEYEKDNTEQNDIRKILFCEETMRLLANEIRKSNSFDWLNDLDRCVNDLLSLSELDSINKARCKKHFEDIVIYQIKKLFPQRYGSYCLGDIHDNVNSLMASTQSSNETLNKILELMSQNDGEYNQKSPTTHEDWQDKSSYTLLEWHLERVEVDGIFAHKDSYTDDIIKLTETWQKERDEYPGWYIIPYNTAVELSMYTDENGLLQKHETEDIDVMLDFAYELCWRRIKTMLPYSEYEVFHLRQIWDKYYIKIKENAGGSDKIRKWFYIGQILLSDYRESMNWNEWQRLMDILIVYQESGNNGKVDLMIERAKACYFKLDMLENCNSMISDEAREILIKLAHEMNEKGIYTKCFDIFILRDEQWERDVQENIFAMNESQSIDSLRAMERYIKRYPDSVITSEMLEKIVKLIELRKEPGLLSAIWILHNLVYTKNTVIDTIGIERIDRLLFILAELINYDNAAMKDIKHCIELRQACAALAFRLFDWKTVNCGKGVEKWREICKSSDEANEVRNQWIW